MSFLKKLGEVVVKGIGLATGFIPLIQGLDEKHSEQWQVVSDDLTKIAGAVATAETFGVALSLPGAEKLRGVAPLIGQIIQQSDFVTGKEIKDFALFQQGCKKIGDGMADVLNSLKG